MRLFHILLLPLCLLSAQVGPGAGLLANMGPKMDDYKCGLNGGHCYYSPCPEPTESYGHCYRGRARCCA
ncbi:Beta-defensin 1 [Myotis davidii]|uniref:Beta-defensin 1 n=1 Tax=Myotis davidii TaxID=225400 RepID=L5LMR2_MYODS|nr:Beta-defensin 1 [Myotis davidii]